MTITATPSDAEPFSYWSGDAGGSANPLVFDPEFRDASYADDFSSDPGWTVLSGAWSVIDSEYRQTSTSWGRTKAISDLEITDGRIAFEATALAPPDGFTWSCFGLYPKYIDADNYIYVRIFVLRPSVGRRTAWEEPCWRCVVRQPRRCIGGEDRQRAGWR